MSGHSKRCVIADDVRFYREMLRRWLSELEFECDVAATGHEALIAAEARHADLMVTDIDMPRTNGFALARAIREHERPDIREIPILFISSLRDSQIESFVRQFGGSGFLAKPLDKNQFLRVAESLTGGGSYADRAFAAEEVREGRALDHCVVSHLLRRLVREQTSSSEA